MGKNLAPGCIEGGEQFNGQRQRVINNERKIPTICSYMDMFMNRCDTLITQEVSIVTATLGFLGVLYFRKHPCLIRC